ncbi:MAG: NepR family anti-sigma factor [Gemmobacter sp.]
MTPPRDKSGRDAQTQDPRATPEQRRQIKHAIDENLRRTYQAALDEDVPDRFHKLLAALRDKDHAS